METNDNTDNQPGDSPLSLFFVYDDAERDADGEPRMDTTRFAISSERAEDVARQVALDAFHDDLTFALPLAITRHTARTPAMRKLLALWEKIALRAVETGFSKAQVERELNELHALVGATESIFADEGRL